MLDHLHVWKGAKQVSIRGRNEPWRGISEVSLPVVTSQRAHSRTVLLHTFWKVEQAKDVKDRLLSFLDLFTMVFNQDVHKNNRY